MNKKLIRKIVKESNVKTRKEHNCYGCGRKFPKGNLMNASRCKINTNFGTKYFCMACHQVMLNKNKNIDSFYYGELLVDTLKYEKSVKGEL